MPKDIEETFARELRKLVAFSMHNSFKEFFEFSRKKGLSLTQIIVLKQLERWGPTPVRDISRHLEISSAAVSQLMDRLVHQELIVRQEDEQDRRIKLHSLSNKGKTLINEINRAHQVWINDFVAAFDTDEAKAAIPVLELLNFKAEALSETISRRAFGHCCTEKKSKTTKLEEGA
jgi:DNA-binding MarR family transcriptional regulator